MRALEEETGCCADVCTEHLSFLRGLVLDGRFADAEEYVSVFNCDRVRYLLRRQHFLELLFARDADADHGSGGGSGAATPTSPGSADGTAAALAAALQSMDGLCTKAEMNSLVMALTQPSTADSDRTPHVGRLACFNAVRAALEPSFRVAGMSTHVAPSTPPGQLLRLFGQAAVAQTAASSSSSPSSSAAAAAAAVAVSASGVFDPKAVVGPDVVVDAVAWRGGDDDSVVDVHKSAVFTGVHRLQRHADVRASAVFAEQQSKTMHL